MTRNKITEYKGNKVKCKTCGETLFPENGYKKCKICNQDICPDCFGCGCDK